MNTLLRGLYAGFLASLVLAGLYFVDYGPGNDFYGVANEFALGNKDTGKFIALALLIVLGVLFGLIFGIIQRNRDDITLGRALVSGLVLGAIWWFVFAFLVAIFIGHISLARAGLGSILYSLTLYLVYGLLLGSLYFQRTVGRVLKSE